MRLKSNIFHDSNRIAKTKFYTFNNEIKIMPYILLPQLLSVLFIAVSIFFLACLFPSKHDSSKKSKIKKV